METTVSSLSDICVRAACASNFWRVQKRYMEMLPEDAANRILQLLIDSETVKYPKDLDNFRYCATKVALKRPVNPSSWIVHIADFTHLHTLAFTHARQLRDDDLAPLVVLADRLYSLDLSGCEALTSNCTLVLRQLHALRALILTDTKLHSPVLAHIPTANLTYLDIGGTHLSDSCFSHTHAMTKLSTLIAWGTNITDDSIPVLLSLPNLTHLDLAWTKVTAMPITAQLRHLNMSSCDISSVWGGFGYEFGEEDLGEGREGGLRELLMNWSSAEGQAWEDVQAVMRMSSHSMHTLQLSHFRSDLTLRFLPNTMHALTSLDVSHCKGVSDMWLESLSGCAALVTLNASYTSIGGAGGIANLLACPGLKTLNLSATALETSAVVWLQQLTSLTSLDISNTYVTYGSKTRTGNQAAPSEAHSSAQPQTGLSPLPCSVPSTWACMHHLAALNVMSTQLNSNELRQLRALTGLQSLVFGVSAPSEVSVSMSARACEKPSEAAVIATISELTQLTYLRMEGLQLTARTARMLLSLPNLQELHITDCYMLGKQDLLPLATRREVLFFYDGSKVAATQLPGVHMKKLGVASERSDELEKYDQRYRHSRDSLLQLRGSPLVGRAWDGSSIVEDVCSNIPQEVERCPW